MRDQRDDLDRQIGRFERRLPRALARALRWIRQPSLKWVRLPAAIALVFAGVVGTFLPILGFWMVPVGLALLAQDVPSLRPPLAKFLAWLDRKWPSRRSAEAK